MRPLSAERTSTYASWLAAAPPWNMTQMDLPAHRISCVIAWYPGSVETVRPEAFTIRFPTTWTGQAGVASTARIMLA